MNGKDGNAGLNHVLWLMRSSLRRRVATDDTMSQSTNHVYGSVLLIGDNTFRARGMTVEAEHQGGRHGRIGCSAG